MNGPNPDDESDTFLKAAFTHSARSRGRSRRKTIPVTVRLTESERERLEGLAAGMTLSTYIRACLFAEQERRRRRRPGSIVADKKAAAEALALLGQSRIANNLNQLAYQANIGALAIEDRERAKIEEAYSLSFRSGICWLQRSGKGHDPRRQ